MSRTAVYIAVAVILGLAALLTRPADPTLEVYDDQGEAFYPEFTDPLAAAALEVIEYDPGSGSATPFKVQLAEGRWSIPSHYDYPADGADRLARTAAGVIGLKKDIIQSDRTQDHEALGVIDPLDETNPSLQGRGTRVTLRDEAGAALAEFIIGNAVEGKPGFRSVRVPGQKRTYAVKADLELSTKFADWIETNLLDMTAFDVTRLDISDYSIDESTGRVAVAGNMFLTRDDQGAWSMFPLPDGKEVDQEQANTLTGYMSRITITGVRPKPGGLSANLKEEEGLSVDLPTQLSLRSKGFYIANGQLLSNEGEVSLGTKDGVYCTLRFGEILFGEGLSVSAGAEEDEASGTDEDGPPDVSGQENRYLFVTASFDENLLPPKPVAPAEGEEVDEAAQTAYEVQLRSWEETANAGREKARRLNERFAPWYYVISGDDFKNIRQDVDKLVKDAETAG
jgi:hypothetical protein